MVDSGTESARTDSDSCGSDRPRKGIKTEMGEGEEAQVSVSQASCPSPALTNDDDHTDDAQTFDLSALADAVDVGDVDVIIGKELAALSREDREQVYYDLHGVAGEVEETKQLIEDSLRALQIALDKIQKKYGYEEALRVDKSFVEDSNFRLRFLRADRFEVPAAAARYVWHFDLKLELFGMDLLCRHIEQDDLDSDDLESLYDATVFAVPSRDSAGRHVSCVTSPSTVNIEAIRRKMFYTAMVRSEDETTVKKGIVTVWFAVGQQLSLEGMANRQRMIRQVARITNAIPTRVEALHLCADSTIFRFVFSVFRMAAAMFSRLRTREHIGSLEEILFSLQTYGIPTHHFPIRDDGTVIKELANECWVKRRNLERKRREEEAISNQTGKLAGDENRVGTPGHNDVLMGRGKSSYTFMGNVRFRNLILEKFPVYDQTATTQRTVVNQTILDEIKSRSGRFLKDDGMGWVEVEDKVALRKVAHAFRTMRALQSDCAPDASNPQGGDQRTKRVRSEDS